jgi:hypothetical protein
MRRLNTHPGRPCPFRTCKNSCFCSRHVPDTLKLTCVLRNYDCFVWSAFKPFSLPIPVITNWLLHCTSQLCRNWSLNYSVLVLSPSPSLSFPFSLSPSLLLSVSPSFSLSPSLFLSLSLFLFP